MRRLAALIMCALPFPADYSPAQPPSESAVGTTAAQPAPTSPEALRSLLSPGSSRLPLVSAHRGGARPGLPENCLETFADTLRGGLALIEVDPRKTRDGQIVLHHDPTLERTTTGSGVLAQHTLAQLESLQLEDPQGQPTPYRIPTLDAALQWAKGKCVLVLDSKDVSLQERVEAVTRHAAEGWAMLIVYSIADAQRCYALNPKIMMEVMVVDRKQFDAFDGSGVPWQNIIAFVGHARPGDPQLLADIHARGACCMAGTSRYLDRQINRASASELAGLKDAYHELLAMGVDVIETDVPLQVGTWLRED